MKKLLLLLSVAICTLSYAQSSKVKGANFGIKAGANLANVNANDTKSKVGFYGGVFMNFPVSETFSIQPEILYSAEGFRSKAESQKISDGNQSVMVNNLRQNFGFINIPVMFQYKATPQFYLEVGPEFGFMINAKLKGDVNVSDTFNVGSGYLYNTFVLGLGLGLGYKFTPNFGVNLRYTAAATNVVKKEYADGKSTRKNAFQLGLEYTFKKKKTF